MSKFSLSKFYNCLKIKKVLSFLKYENKYVNILFILIHEGLLRGFYFEYILKRKYIVMLLKYNVCSLFDFNKISRIKKIDRSFKLYLWTTNCGIMINSNKSVNNNLLLTVL